MPHFTLNSPDLQGFVDKQYVYDGFGAGGDNQSPALTWSNPPAGTRAYLLTCHDTDAPGPGGWWHWVAFNIPGDITSLPTDAAKQGMPVGTVMAVNSYGDKTYGGPCPPPGDQAHPYVFTLYALGAELDLDDSAQPAMVMFMAQAAILGKASVVSYYAR